MKRLFAALLVAFLIHPPVYADEQPRVLYPLVHQATDPGTLTVVIEAPDRAWGLRKVAANYDRRLDNVDIRAKRGISCTLYVECIRVEVGQYGRKMVCGHPGLFYGCFYMYAEGPRWIALNESLTPESMRKAIVCHELGHALGLDHHEGPGCVTGESTGRPSRAEIRTIDQRYASE